MADQNNPNMMALKDLLAFQPNVGGAMPTVAPTAMVQPQLSPTAQYVQNMQALMSGGIGKLSTGEKLGALGQILQAAGSRGRVDPGAVIQNVRQQQMQKLNAQYQIAQLQQQAAQEQRKRAFITEYASVLPEDKRGLLENADTDKAYDIIEKELTAKKQLFQIVDGPTGNKVAVFSDNSRVETDLPNNLQTELVDRGSQKLLINSDTGDIIRTYDKDLSPYMVRRTTGRPSAPTRRTTSDKKPGGKKTSAAPISPEILSAITQRLGGIK
jgi:hypothetical protein